MEEQTAKSEVKAGQQNDVKKQWSFMRKLVHGSFRNTKGSDDHSKTNHVKSHALPDRTCQSVFYHPVETDGCLTNEDKNDSEDAVRSDGEEQPLRNSEDELNVSLSMHNGVTVDQTNDAPAKQSIKKAISIKWSADNPKTDCDQSHEDLNTTCKSVCHHPMESEELLTDVDKNDLENTVRSNGKEHPRKRLEKEKHNVSHSMQSDVRDGEPHNVQIEGSMVTKPKNKKSSIILPKTEDVKSHALSERVSKSVFYHPVDSEKDLTNEDKNDLENTVRSDNEEHPTQSSEKEEHSAHLSTQNDVRQGQRRDISLLQSMLDKLENSSVDHPKTDYVKSHACQDRADKCVFYPSVKTEGCLACEDKNELDSTIKPHGDEQPNPQKEDRHEAVEELIGPPNEIPKWERRIFIPVSVSLQTSAEEGKTLEVKNNNESSVEEHMAEDASLLDSPSQQSSAQESDLSMSSDRADCAQMESKHEPLDEACAGPSTPVSADPSRSQTHQTVSIRQIRSASDPVAHKPKEERPLSAPSISNQQDYEKYTQTMALKSLEKTETQKKGGKKGMKFFTQKLMAKLKEKQDEQTDSKMIQESGQEVTPSIISMQMDAEIPPPLPQKKGKYVVLNRNFTLRDFKLNLEPIDLMGEIFTGEEWLSYLPSKTSPDEKDAIDQSKTYKVLESKNDSKLNDLQPIPEQDQSEDINDNQKKKSELNDLQQISGHDQSEDMNDNSKNDSEFNDLIEQDQSDFQVNNQVSIKHDQQDKVAQVNTESHLKSEESEAKYFAIPKALLTNNAIANAALGTDYDKSEDVYDRVDMYIIPKNDNPVINRKSSDISPLDWTVKSCALLDNSALKSRIRVSKKRNHRPPKQHKNVKTEVSNTKFYSVPPTILNTSPVNACLPRHSFPFSTSPLHSPPHL